MFIVTNRIALFIPSFNGGGAERVIVTLANAFVSRGYIVDLLVVFGGGVHQKNINNRVNIIDLKLNRVANAIPSLIRYIINHKPVVFLSFLTHSNIISLISVFLSRTTTRIYVSERGTISSEYTASRGIISKFIFFLVPFLYRYATGICSVSNSAAIDLANFTGISVHKIKSLPNPFDIDLIINKSNDPVNCVWFLTNQSPIIIALGRLDDSKDFHTLISAFAVVKKSRNIRLMILGEGGARSSLESHIDNLGLSSNDICLPGFVNNPYAYLAKARLFVLSSRREGLPGALIEAMVCGLPIISTDCLSGPREILDNGKWGRLIPVGDVSKLAIAIEDVLDTPINLLPDVKKRANDYSIDKSVDEYLNFMSLNKYHFDNTPR